MKAYYNFGGGKAESSSDDLKILGGKGAGLAEMSRAGIPVPPGFVISTEVCGAFYESGMQVPSKIDKELESHVAKIEKLTGTKFGDPSKPLLLSVRSGSAVSMPGMMDTILNLGLNQETLEGFIKKSGDAKFAYDNYRRLIQMFGDVVLSIDRELFERIVTKIKEDRRIKSDSSLQAKDLQDIINKYRSLIKRKSGEPFPDDPFVQLRMARDAVFRSWNNPRAISYRRMTNVPSHLGTAVTVQAMVFGNSGRKSGTGVGFTRDPSTGENVFYGEYLVNAQGEDVVAGIRTPLPISKLEQDMPDMYKKLRDITRKLEKRYRDVQDFEFTIDNGKLYMLQTRRGKRTVQAAVKIAVDMTHEKLITRDEALMRIKPTDLDQLLHPRIDTSAKYEVIAKGLAASPGAASGMVCFTSEEAVKLAAAKKSVILVRKETNPDDIEGMEASAGILTSRGGMTSHAAVVARGMGSCCVAGAESLRVNEKKKMFQVGKLTIKEGEIITLNGSTGEIILGKAPTIEPELSAEFNEF
ncbi:MAG: pyruvate, phosphate dikinase, partial [candidate division Zixibacteria bacterium]|nr:pyruvate, phosphate dikinase [candidate division Zixibacteria bacterium]